MNSLLVTELNVELAYFNKTLKNCIRLFEDRRNLQDALKKQNAIKLFDRIFNLFYLKIN